MAENDWTTTSTVLTINGIPLDLEMTVPAKPIKPHRMLPIFHQMANAFTQVGVEAAEGAGRSISCKAGCGACCRQPVPISEIEVYQIAELVEAMPEPRRSVVKKRFADAVDHFRGNGMIDELRKHYDYGRPKTSRKQIEDGLEAAMKLFYEGIPCPFLENESCSIHQNRPVVCREYLVTSPAANCTNPSATSIRKVELPIKPSGALGHLGRTERMREEGPLLLILALELAKAYPENFPEKTGEQWMGEFFATLRQTEAACSIPPTKPTRGRRKKRKRRS